MSFRIVEIFGRSVTIERDSDSCYRTDEPCDVFINGDFRLRTDLNVITIDGLLPSTSYDITVDGETLGFVTAQESMLIDIRQFGAVANSDRLQTSSVQAAIVACPEGGTVWIPKGEYLISPLFLKSNITLWLDEGAVLKGSPNRSDYPVLPGIIRNIYDNSKEYNIASWEGNPLDCFASLITAIGCENIDIMGRGRIDGNASESDWWTDVRKKRGAWRPRLVFLSRCRNVRVQGISLGNSPSWTVHPYYSDHMRFLNLSIWNPSDSPNTDGFDPESCEDVLLLGTKISVGDDCVAIKSGKLYMAHAHFKPIKDVVIRNCLFERGHGSVTLGSEVAGGVGNVRVSQCVFSGTDRGVRIKTRRGRGEKSVLTDMLFENIIMDNVHMPITVNMFYFCDPDGHSSYVQDQGIRPVDYRTPKIGGLTFRDIKCSGADASFVCAYGLPESPIGKIELKDIEVSFLPEEKRKDTCPIMMDGFPKMNGKSLFLKNVEELEIDNLTIRGSSDDRPELINVAKTVIGDIVYN